MSAGRHTGARARHLDRRTFYRLPSLYDQWLPVLWVISILTMPIGTSTGMNQTGVKQILTYSSITHIGFILPG